ncbi:MAG TPA: peptidoglycan-binding protein LysM [Flavobacterium sp.]|jgi:hypothetical protein
MIKKWTYFASLTLIIAFLSSGFKPVQNEYHDWFHTSEEVETPYIFPSQKSTDYTNLNIPFTGKYFIAYKEAIAFKESQGKYALVNTFGYMGKYQFGMSALRAIGIKDRNSFLNSPKLQEKAFVALLSKNKWELREEIRKYEGKIVAGVRITESGILAAAHLGGAGSVKKFFKTAGKRYMRDGYGTSLRSYMKRFGGYETSAIVADSNARVQ